MFNASGYLLHNFCTVHDPLPLTWTVSHPLCPLFSHSLGLLYCCRFELFRNTHRTQLILRSTFNIDNQRQRDSFRLDVVFLCVTSLRCCSSQYTDICASHIVTILDLAKFYHAKPYIPKSLVIIRRF